GPQPQVNLPLAFPPALPNKVADIQFEPGTRADSPRIQRDASHSQVNCDIGQRQRAHVDIFWAANPRTLVPWLLAIGRLVSQARLSPRIHDVEKMHANL